MIIRHATHVGEELPALVLGESKDDLLMPKYCSVAVIIAQGPPHNSKAMYVPSSPCEKTENNLLPLLDFHCACSFRPRRRRRQPMNDPNLELCGRSDLRTGTGMYRR